MSDFVHPNTLGKTTSRRVVLRTGAKLAYATPIIAATFTLAHDAAAGRRTLPRESDCVCPAGTTEVTRYLPAHLGKCAACLPGYYYRPQTGQCIQGRTRILATFTDKICAAAASISGP